MHEVTTVELKRNCEAARIPSGDAVILEVGTLVDITQTLGGSYTVRCHGALFRIVARDADALGLAPAPGVEVGTASDGPADEQAVWAALKNCYDPEIPVNIVDLGLVYSMEMEKLPSGNRKVSVKMTLTAPGCGMGGAIAGDAQQKLLGLPGIEEANVDIVWDPPWHHAMITETGRKILGID
jgi:probable FeS assembly SUF system protein SufT